MEINGKVAVVTGGARGIGRQFTFDLLKQGAKVAICDINEDFLNDAYEFFDKNGYKVDSYKMDVTNEKDVELIFEKIAKKHNGFDIVVNNAGIVKDHLLVKKNGENFEKFPIEDWNKVIAVNLTGVFLCAREAAYQMIKYKKKGVIVSMSSISREGNIGQTNYTATKAGVSAMTVTWAKELSRYGIRVAAIAPGYIDTELTAPIPEKIKEKLKAIIPLGRFGTKEEISKTLIFIIENDYITGRTIEVDGGLRI